MTRRRQITFDMSVQSIDKAIARIRAEEEWLKNGMNRLLVRFGDELRNRIDANLSMTAIQVSSSKVIHGKKIQHYEYRSPEYSVSTMLVGNSINVIISGQDAIWVEFGTGVATNTPVGTSPNPWGAMIGFTIGSYGKGNGAKRAWGYYDADGTINITFGTNAQMPIYNACKDVVAMYPALVKEVFGT